MDFSGNDLGLGDELFPIVRFFLSRGTYDTNFLLWLAGNTTGILLK